MRVIKKKAWWSYFRRWNSSVTTCEAAILECSTYFEKFKTYSENLIECIEKYKKDKVICFKNYINYKKEIKDVVHFLFKEESLKMLNKNNLLSIFTYSVLLCNRISFPHNEKKNLLLLYIDHYIDKKDKYVNNNHKDNDNDNHNDNYRDNNIYDQKEKAKELLLILKYIFYLNVDYDKYIFNHIYHELNNYIDLYSLEELNVCVKLLSNIKNKKWINHKIFTRCINEIINKYKDIKITNQHINNINNNVIINIIKACSRLNYEINDIQILLDHFKNIYQKETENYDNQNNDNNNNDNKQNNENIYMLIKIIYNLFLSNYHNYKHMNQLLYLLKIYLCPNEAQKEYPIYHKYNYNNNIILDNNINYNNEQQKHNISSNYISNDNINNINQLYFYKQQNKYKNIISRADTISYINIYRLKFIYLLITSDNYLFNNFYTPNANFFDVIRDIHIKDIKIKETIFSKHVENFLKESGLKISHNIVHIYPIVKLTNYKNTCVELIHNISINKKMKESPNKLHKNYINHKIKHLQFLGWNVIILYEYEWKALRNFDEKLEYIKKKFKSIKEHEQS
ncbi:conserved Plasmodium protein, unknown function [Plasmodium reichenowi]|uniref:RAP domain-containing protein n=1 Tax=Plasmodium reichenowi TaxID=5854 RepID=A0A2P9DRB5_PLARE|nr:conserved Plasmodium protein, unknown function [Plasmodium reichenowi]